jgi:hypothetical protein
MIGKKLSILILVLMSSYHPGYTQNIFTDLKKLERRGDYYYSKLAYVKALDFYSQALEKKRNKNNYNLNLKAAGLYKKMACYPEAKQCYDNIIASGHGFTPEDSMNYFNILKAAGVMEPAFDLSKRYSRKILNDLFRDSLYYIINELPFNTDESEYCPVFFHGGIMYVSDQKPSSLVQKYNALNNGGFAFLNYTGRKDDFWLEPKEMRTDINNLLHVGPVSLYNNQKNAILNVCIEDHKKPNRLLLYTAEYDEEKEIWKGITPMPFNNNSYSVGHPAISEDGKNIFFVSDMNGGKGGTDIYFSRNVNGVWSTPANMGAKINTTGNEKYPHINKDNVLFFSSDGRYGLGGLDMYYVDLDFKDSIVMNMGFPVNSSLDDFGFNYDEVNKTGYFSSNRKSDGKQDDLYLFKENRILLNVVLKDDFDKKDLENAKVQLWDNELNVPVKYTKGEESNRIDAWLRPAHQYKMIIQKEDYKNDTLLISTYDMKDYTESILKTEYVKRKFIYYADLKFQNEVSQGSLENSLIKVNNLTDAKIDSIDHTGTSLKVKLDAECEYIITSRNKNTLSYIYVGKKTDMKISSKSYYNMYLTPAKPSIHHVIVTKCTGEKRSEGNLDLKLKVFDWVNGNEFFISPGPDGDFQFIVTDARLFDIYLNDNRVLYSKQRTQSKGYCLSFIEN